MTAQKTSEANSGFFYSKGFWQKLVDGFDVAADLSNIGIVIHLISTWVPRLAFLASSSVIAFTALIADPLIYFFRSLTRLTRLIGRHYFGIAFREEEINLHAYQSVGDIFSLTFFSSAAVIFALVAAGIAASPVFSTIGWVLGLSGLSIVVYFDYYYAQKKAEENLNLLCDHKGIKRKDVRAAEDEYNYRKYAARLMISLVAMLSLALICGSAIAFAPLAVVPALTIIAKITSAVLVPITAGRLINFFSRKPYTSPLASLDHSKNLANSNNPGASSSSKALLRLEAGSVKREINEEDLAASQKITTDKDKRPSAAGNLWITSSPQTLQPSNDQLLNENRDTRSLHAQTKY
jgi:hypothetical protein